MNLIIIQNLWKTYLYLSKVPAKNLREKLFQLKKPEKSAISVRKFLKEAIDFVITKSMFEDARNFTNLLLAKIQLNAAYVQVKKNLRTKEHCTFILKKCTLTKNVKFARTQFWKSSGQITGKLVKSTKVICNKIKGYFFLFQSIQNVAIWYTSFLRQDTYLDRTRQMNNKDAEWNKSIIFKAYAFFFILHPWCPWRVCYWCFYRDYLVSALFASSENNINGKTALIETALTGESLWIELNSLECF